MNEIQGLSKVLLGFLGARAGMRVLTYLVFKIAGPPPGEVSEAQWETMQAMDAGLLAIENLLTFVAMILFLIWIYRLTKAVRARGGKTTLGPGMAVGGWFIPFANAVLPWISVRDALRELKLAKILAGVWWILWLINIPLNGTQQLARQINTTPELLDILPPDFFEMTSSTFWPHFLVDTGAWAMLFLIVFQVRKATAPQA